MNTEEATQMIHGEESPDFVALKRFDFSLARVCERYPDGAPDHVVAQALMVTEDEVEGLYQEIAVKMRHLMGVGS